MKNELRVRNFLFSSFGFFIVKQMCRHPKVVKWLFDTKMRREKWI